MKKRCLMLIGLPASGKSTFTESFLADKNKAEWTVLSADKWIDKMASAASCTYDDIWKDGYKVAEQMMFDDLRCAIKAGRNLIWDQTNLTTASRGKKLPKIPKDVYEIEAVYFVTPDRDDWYKRLTNRPGKTIPPKVLSGMLLAIEYPTRAEGFSKIHFFDSQRPNNPVK